MMEGKLVASTAVQDSLDSADLAARTMASATTVRRCSRLQSSGLPPEVQQTIQDLPFKDPSLFSEKNG